jgi:hypothetical protein
MHPPNCGRVIELVIHHPLEACNSPTRKTIVRARAAARVTLAGRRRGEQHTPGYVGVVSTSYARSLCSLSARAMRNHLMPNSPAVMCGPGPPFAALHDPGGPLLSPPWQAPLKLPALRTSSISTDSAFWRSDFGTISMKRARPCPVWVACLGWAGGGAGDGWPPPPRLATAWPAPFWQAARTTNVLCLFGHVSPSAGRGSSTHEDFPMHSLRT